MAEDVRAVLSQCDEKHLEQHGVEIAAVAKYDVHLERGVVFVVVVGEVSNFHE